MSTRLPSSARRVEVEQSPFQCNCCCYSIDCVGVLSWNVAIWHLSRSNLLSFITNHPQPKQVRVAKQKRKRNRNAEPCQRGRQHFNIESNLTACWLVQIELSTLQIMMRLNRNTTTRGFSQVIIMLMGWDRPWAPDLVLRSSDWMTTEPWE